LFEKELELLEARQLDRHGGNDAELESRMARLRTELEALDGSGANGAGKITPENLAMGETAAGHDWDAVTSAPTDDVNTQTDSRLTA
jgi:hypothetical protein